ncbi:MAG: PDZ domain-containing protein, partial [Acidobacteria bacterium]|nr:PDZ domain-containing protein [Acidobacteriota bacterium]
TEVLARIKADYVEEPDIDLVTRGALQGLVEYLDPMSSYLSPEQYKEYQERQKFPDGGTGWSTGMIVHKRGNYTAVLSVLPGSPAAKAGIEPMDLIEAIDDRSTRMMPPALLYARLSGPVGDEVKLLVRSSREYDEPVEKKLTRSKVSLPQVESKILEPGVGYLKIAALTKDTPGQIGKAVKNLEKQGATSLVLDLRGDSIGSPSDGVKLADLFLSEGKIASLKGQKVPEETFQASPDTTVTTMPLAVLVDRPTANGAEVAAAALLDSGRAEVIGERTYGLAAKQETIDLDDGAALILSTGKYYRPEGEAVHDKGVTPKHLLDPADLRRFRNPAEGEERGPDPFLQKALSVLKPSA